MLPDFLTYLLQRTLPVIVPEIPQKIDSGIFPEILWKSLGILVEDPPAVFPGISPEITVRNPSRVAPGCFQELYLFYSFFRHFFAYLFWHSSYNLFGNFSRTSAGVSLGILQIFFSGLRSELLPNFLKVSSGDYSRVTPKIPSGTLPENSLETSRNSCRDSSGDISWNFTRDHSRESF